MKVVRRGALTVIVAASLVTAAVGGAIAALVIDYAGERDTLWRLILGVTGVAAAVVGCACAYLVGRDLRRGSLSAQAEQWTWVATVAFTLVTFATVWWFYFGLVGPLVTALFICLARGPRAGPPRPGAPRPSAG